MMAVAGSSEMPLPIYQTTQSTKKVNFNWITFLNTIAHIQSNIGTHLQGKFAHAYWMGRNFHIFYISGLDTYKVPLPHNSGFSPGNELLVSTE